MLHSLRGDPLPDLYCTEPPPEQPLAPEIFYGRDDLVSELAMVIRDHQRPRIALLGSGGIGKTFTALHIIHQKDVVA